MPTGIYIGIDTGMSITSSSGSSWTPQKDAALMTKLLFWGKVSEISGGQMPNKVTGTTDYLTVSGSPATYRTPNSIVSLGNEIIPNGTFDNGGGWTQDSGWVVGGGKANANMAEGGGVHRQLAFVVGHTYRVSFEVTDYISGTVNYLQDYSTAGTSRNSVGIFTQDFIYATGTIPGRTEIQTTSGFVGSIDNFSIKEVTLIDTGYIAADTDYVWFQQNGTQRTVTTVELIGYDFARTLVKYDNITPYALKEIIILRAGQTLTTSEENLIRDYMQLSNWWNDVLSLRGVFKENKRAGKVNFYGIELAINGSFVADSNWTKDTGSTISGGKLNISVATGGGGVHQTIILEAGESYRVSFEITDYTSGSVAFWKDWNGFKGMLRYAIGVYTENFEYSVGDIPNRTEIRVLGDFVGSVDNFSLIKIS